MGPEEPRADSGGVAVTPASGFGDRAGAAREVDADVSLARGFRSHKAESFDALPVVTRSVGPSRASSPPPLSGRPSIEAGAPDWRGLVEGPTDRERSRPDSRQETTPVGRSPTAVGSQYFEAPYGASAVRLRRSPYIPCM